MRILLGLLILLASAMAVSASYNVIVAENGNAFIATSLAGEGTVNLPLPIDAAPQITGALYITAPNGIDITVGSVGAANIIYQSSTLTTKEDGVWVFEMNLSSADPNSITISLPLNTNIISSSPQANIIPISNSKNIVWDDAGNGIMVSYSFTESALTPAESTSDYTIPIIVGAVIIAAVLGFVLLKKKA